MKIVEWFMQSDLYKGLQLSRVPPGPNVLRYLFRLDDEVRLHTPMLGWLMDPNGDHGLGAKPLQQLLENLGIPTEDALKAEVLQEQAYEGVGRVDLEVRLPNRWLIIENKLSARDQKSQLWRYRQILSRQAGNAIDTHLFYLTLDGDQPSPEAMRAPSGEVLGNDKVTCISYRADICGWLGELRSLAEDQSLIKIRVILEQYLEVVMSVVGVHSREEALARLQESGLRQSLERKPDNIGELAQVVELVTLLHASLLDELIQSIASFLRTECKLPPALGPSHWKELNWSVCESWAKGNRVPAYLSYSVPEAREHGMSLVMGLDAKDKMWVGLACLDGKHLSVPPETESMSLKLTKLYENSDYNEWWVCWLTVPGLDPARFAGKDGAANLTSPTAMVDMRNQVIAICQRLLEEARKG